ncbi:MAG TPA: pyridoxamine 5'-phosphate oxidase family protein [Thermoleophilaceae bacterium]|jgi:PPOX class probable F420-dependent enzyme
MTPAGLEDVPGWARELIEHAPVAHLGLIDGRARPRVLPVTFALCGEDLVSAVDHKPKRVEGRELARVRWLRREPSAALTVDRYDDDWSRLAWVQALGRAEVLDKAPPGALDALGAKYEQYRERPPAGPFIRLVPDRFVCWTA